MDDETDLPWPRLGDVLFSSGRDWWNNACLNWAGTAGDWELYTGGYKLAADILVEHVKQTHCDQDNLVFPIVFLYRQYLELRLKGLIVDAKRFLDEEGRYPKEHGLASLWDECKPLITQAALAAGDRETPDEFKAVDEAIVQFEALDSRSFAFRYPTDTHDNPSLPADLRHINLRNLGEVMDRLASFLDSASTMISVWQECKNDIEREFRDAAPYDFDIPDVL